MPEAGSSKRNVLFVCEDNAARSQMAQALLNHLYGDYYQAFSAGINPTELDEHASTVLNEMGIDPYHLRAKSVDECIKKRVGFDIVATLCDCSKQNCPFFPANLRLHHEFVNPQEFTGEHEEMLMHYRRLRDEIRSWIEFSFGPDSSMGFYMKVRKNQ